MNLRGYKCDVTGCDSTLLLPKKDDDREGETPAYMEAGWDRTMRSDGSPIHICPRCRVAAPLLRDLYVAAQQVKGVAETLEDLGFVFRDCDDASHDREGCRFHVYYDTDEVVVHGELHARVIAFLGEWAVNVVERWKVLLGPNNEPI